MLLRQMAVALLFNEHHEVLFLQKKVNSRFLPGQLVPIGGHIVGGETGDPKRACLREIEEETGLEEHALTGLALRYIVHRMKDDQEIRIQYIFTGKVAADSELVESEEGRLSWVDCRTASHQPVTASTEEVMRHYLETGIHNNTTYIGTMHASQGQAAMSWSVLEDWEGRVSL
ncbi:NUDIX domain-containing protein [Paenibacillus sp. S150]|uniref:NUDIX domain-containing protein n=1 Tax=Paenibacillus sp. S150 TaxID=2749826 RepID=UPI001C57DA96|nr:NUDIX domain-containing protein [Paenibacillus sp. S150]MBW4082365.1 NUDIX domain-containing protein [Paenibacillus sp. S150]